jgi:hypothetical protein
MDKASCLMDGVRDRLVVADVEIVEIPWAVQRGCNILLAEEGEIGAHAPIKHIAKRSQEGIQALLHQGMEEIPVLDAEQSQAFRAKKIGHGTPGI